MSIFRFETSFPFPIVKVTTLVNHTEVSKPTGISYIILVLINESSNKKSKLSTLLLQFGVPSDLHSIFADEIYNLIHELEIIQCTPYEYNRLHFAEYLVGNFVFTEKGKKVFKDELIPARKAIESKQEIFYDPAHNHLMEKIPIDWKIGRIDDSILPNELAEKFEYNSKGDLEEYLNSVKGKGIIVKKDEIITNVSIMSNEYFYTTFPITLVIDNNMKSINFELEDNRVQAFFEKYYDNQLISEGLGIKRKFKFKGKQPEIVDEKVINKGLLMLPEDYQGILNETVPMIITKANNMAKQSVHVLENDKILSKINANIESIHIHNKDNIVACMPVQVLLKYELSKTSVPINLLVVSELEEHDKILLIKGLMEEFKSYSINNVKEIIYIFKLLNERRNLELLMDQYLTFDVEGNINILKEINDTLDISYIQDWFNKKIQENYDQYFKNVPIKTLEYKFALGGWMIKHLNIKNVTIISKIVESNHSIDPEKIFYFLESLNFPLSDIFAQVNILNVFIQKIINNSKIDSIGNFSNLIKTIQFGLNQLKGLTEITKPYEFIIKEDIDRTKFQEVYSGFSTKLEELLKYEKFDVAAFIELKEFNMHFKYLSRIFTEEKNANNNPKSIDQSFINSKINKKEYFTAISYLFAKLEWILKDQYKLRGKTESMINELKDIEELRVYIPELHQLRKTRNSLMHPRNSEVLINSSELTNWSNIVFKEVLKT